MEWVIRCIREWNCFGRGREVEEEEWGWIEGGVGREVVNCWRGWGVVLRVWLWGGLWVRGFEELLEEIKDGDVRFICDIGVFCGCGRIVYDGICFLLICCWFWICSWCIGIGFVFFMFNVGVVMMVVELLYFFVVVFKFIVICGGEFIFLILYIVFLIFFKVN